MPLREIEDKFTKSELVLVAWSSQEKYHNMLKKMDDSKAAGHEEAQKTLELARKTADERLQSEVKKLVEEGVHTAGNSGDELVSVPGFDIKVPKKYVNENGELDMRKMPGSVARRFMAAQGIELPVMLKG